MFNDMFYIKLQPLNHAEISLIERLNIIFTEVDLANYVEIPRLQCPH